jgi:hypothetical protein
MNEFFLLDPEGCNRRKAERLARRAQSIIESQRASAIRERLEQQRQCSRIASATKGHGGISLRFRLLNRRNHQLRLLLGDRRDV